MKKLILILLCIAGLFSLLVSVNNSYAINCPSGGTPCANCGECDHVTPGPEYCGCCGDLMDSDETCGQTEIPGWCGVCDSGENCSADPKCGKCMHHCSCGSADPDDEWEIEEVFDGVRCLGCFSDPCVCGVECDHASLCVTGTHCLDCDTCDCETCPCSIHLNEEVPLDQCDCVFCKHANCTLHEECAECRVPILEDADGDGLTDELEAQIGTNPLLADTDGDGLDDWGEYTFGLNPLGALASELEADSDGDGIPNGYEVENRLNPWDAADKELDSDRDDLSNIYEYENGLLAGNRDSDGDSLRDGKEVELGTDPLIADDVNADSDADGLSLKEEFVLGTKPDLADTDGDGFNDLDDDDPLQGDADSLRIICATETTGFWSHKPGFVHYKPISHPLTHTPSGNDFNPECIGYMNEVTEYDAVKYYPYTGPGVPSRIEEWFGPSTLSLGLVWEDSGRISTNVSWSGGGKFNATAHSHCGWYGRTDRTVCTNRLIQIYCNPEYGFIGHEQMPAGDREDCPRADLWAWSDSVTSTLSAPLSDQKFYEGILSRMPAFKASKKVTYSDFYDGLDYAGYANKAYAYYGHHDPGVDNGDEGVGYLPENIGCVKKRYKFIFNKPVKDKVVSWIVRVRYSHVAGRKVDDGDWYSSEDYAAQKTVRKEKILFYSERVTGSETRTYQLDPTIYREQDLEDEINVRISAWPELVNLNSNITPDYNRDGKIDALDQSRADTNEVFRFWVNDDNDAAADSSGTSGNDLPGANIDNKDTSVNTIRDLVDFFPVHLKIKGALDYLDNIGIAYEVRLTSNVELGIMDLLMPTMYPLTATNSFAYLNDTKRAFPAVTQVTKVDANNPMVINPSFLLQLQNDPLKGIHRCPANPLEVCPERGAKVREIGFGRGSLEKMLPKATDVLQRELRHSAARIQKRG